MKQQVIDYLKKNADGSEFSGRVVMNMPTSFEEAGQMWGEQTTLSKAIAQVVIDARRLCYAAATPEEAQDKVSAFVPGVHSRSSTGMSKKALAEELNDMSEDELRQMLEEIRLRKAKK